MYFILYSIISQPRRYGTLDYSTTIAPLSAQMCAAHSEIIAFLWTLLTLNVLRIRDVYIYNTQHTWSCVYYILATYI